MRPTTHKGHRVSRRRTAVGRPETGGTSHQDICEPGADEDVDDPGFHLADTLARSPELGIDLDKVIARLPPRARAVLVLHDVEGWKHEEISGELGMAVGSSKAQLHRARNLIKQWLGGPHGRA